MRRALPQPFDTGIAHGGVGVQAFGDRMTDDGLTFLPEQGDELLLLLNQPINLRRLVVQERCDLLLFFDWRSHDSVLIEVIHAERCLHMIWNQQPLELKQNLKC